MTAVISFLLIALLTGMLWSWRRGSRVLAVVLAVVAVLPAVTLSRSLSWPALTVVVLLVVVLGWIRWTRTSATVTRWGARSRRKAGVASTFDIARVGSGPAVKRRAAVVRPSLDYLSRRPWLRWRWWRLPTIEVGVRLCRAGLLNVWSSVEDVTLVFGGPRTGKTQWLAGRVLDAPGAVLVTSTRTDLLELCRPLRDVRGPVEVFNAVGLAELASTITFDPLTGCTDPVVAMERATDMIAATTRASRGGDREFWETQARRVLAALLHAAALGGRHMRDVLGWVADPDRAERDVSVLLRRMADPVFERDALQFLKTNDRTRTSITSTIMPALGWLTSPAAAAAAEPSGWAFDVADLLARRATVFLLGAEESHAAPLVCALTGHIAREARRLAALEPGGRLDPPLTLVLDEAALIAPVPLESWTADMGGRGVTILAAFQSRAQVLARWGEYAAATILNNTSAVMVFGGTRDRDDLQFWSTLTGERDERIITTDLHGRVASRTTRRVAVLAPAQIANLPAGKVLLIRRGLAPVVGRVQPAWRRRDVRAQRRAAARTARTPPRPSQPPFRTNRGESPTSGSPRPIADPRTRCRGPATTLSTNETAGGTHDRRVPCRRVGTRAGAVVDRPRPRRRCRPPRPVDPRGRARPPPDHVGDPAARHPRVGHRGPGDTRRLRRALRARLPGRAGAGRDRRPARRRDRRRAHRLPGLAAAGLSRDQRRPAPHEHQRSPSGNEAGGTRRRPLVTQVPGEDADPNHRTSTPYWWLFDVADPDRIATYPDSIQEGWDHDAARNGPDAADELFDAENPHYEPPAEVLDAWAAEDDHDGSDAETGVNGSPGFDVGDAEPDLASRLAALQPDITASPERIDGWGTVGREETAHRLTEHGVDLPTARDMVTDYLRQTSERAGVAADQWGLDQTDVDAIAADHHLPAPGRTDEDGIGDADGDEDVAGWPW